MKKIFMVFVLCSVLTACNAQPSEGQIQTAIALTQVAQPTATLTSTPLPTFTPTQTLTPTPEATNTPEPTLTPTPDLRVITADPRDFLWEKKDLLSEGLYYVPNAGWMGINTNEEIISAWTVEEGREYIFDTEREVGWFIAYYRGTRSVALPEQIYTNVVRYKTSEGAYLAQTKYSLASRDDYNEWEIIERDIELGDFHESYLYKERTSGGDYLVTYRVYFCYKNFGVDVWGYGYDVDVQYEFVESLARNILEKLQAADLSLPEG